MTDTERVTRDERGHPTIHVDASKPIAEQLAEPEVRAAVEGVVRDAMGGASLWGEVATEPAEPIRFEAARKDLLHALTRTQHALSDADERPVLQSWWLTVEAGLLTIHAADNYRLARATVDVLAEAEGRFGVHRSEGKALLAFLATGPSSVVVDVAGGSWSVSHDEGRLTGRLSPGEPPDWSRVTDRGEPELTFALNGKYTAEAAKAAVGESGVVLVDWRGEDQAVLYRSQGYDEWVMPVRTPSPQVAR